MEVGTERIKIFFSYAREDQKSLHILQKFLVPLKRAGSVTDWHDGNISVKAFAEALEQAIAGTVIITPSEPIGGALGRRSFLVGIGLAGLVVGGAGGFFTRFLFSPRLVQAPPIIKIVTPTPSPLKLPHIFFGHVSEVNTVAWSPNGRFIVSGSRDNTAKIWDVTTGENIFTYNQHNNWVNTVAWSLDGKRIASGSADQKIQVWEVKI